MTPPLLEIDQLSLTLFKGQRPFPVLHEISFCIYPGEIVGLVGESGSGKSLTASALLGLISSPHELKGRILFEGRDLMTQSPRERASIRGTRLSAIFQDPNRALNPLVPIGRQVIEGICFHRNMPRKQAFELGVQWLARMGIDEPRRRMHQYPHEISGGMKQRVLIAMALICRPALLIADEPTTALDVTLQAQILDLLQIVQREERMSILLITHDLGVVARCCQRVMVMYAGRLVETGPVARMLTFPKHPYMQALLHSRLSLERTGQAPLTVLEGHPPSLEKIRVGCAFVSRCPSAMTICSQQIPPCEKTENGSVECWLTRASGGIP